MTISRATAETLEVIRFRVRRKVGDPATTADGRDIEEAIRKYSDADIDEAVNDMLVYMQNEIASQDMGEALIWTDLEYVEGDDEDGCLLPAGINVDAIYKVDDRTGDRPFRLAYVSPLEVEQYYSPEPALATLSVPRRYTLITDPASNGYRILIRPTASGRTFRIHHVAPPLVVNTAADSHLLTIRWREYITLGAALSLHSTTDQAPVQLAALYEDRKQQFKDFCTRQRGPERIRLVRKRTT